MGHSAGSEIATQQKAIPMGRLSKIAEHYLATYIATAGSDVLSLDSKIEFIEGSHRKMNAPAIPFFGYIL
ncbi:hypothetical protein QMN03_05985 [Leptospira santarosai]|uniref:hypothetical protein n=2 Tax=Leptospira santarosai TaxID=28183 RepID=UPI0024AF3EDB|nr:hypothetical protein [Leptospira santarosai]MDI7206453.1 hypothetical protein [Leptospira santarosai]